MRKFFSRALCGLLGTLVLGTSLGADPQGKPQLEKLKEQIEIFESVLNQSLTQAFGGPFATLDRTRGAYLPGYGVVFAFEVNLSSWHDLGPFGSSTTPGNASNERDEENRRREKAKLIAEETLASYGQTLSQLGPNETIAIVIHTVAAHPNQVERSTIVLSGDKKLIDQRQRQAIDQADFIRKLSTTQY